MASHWTVSADKIYTLTQDDRDSEDSAPAEYPPEQPEADRLDDDEEAYGAEEADMQADLERELAEVDANVTTAKVEANGGDHEMEGADEGVKAEDEEGSDAGSEDLEAESSDDEEDEEEEEGEGDGDEEMEVDEGEQKAQAAGEGSKAKGKPVSAQQAEVMVH